MSFLQNDPIDDRLLLLVSEGKTVREMSADVNRALANVHYRLTKMMKQGLLTKKQPGRSRRPYLLTEMGRKYLEIHGYIK